MAQLMAGIRGEDDRTGRGRCEQRPQRFEPAHDAAAALGGRLPPRAARGHDDNRRGGAVAAGGIERDDDVAGGSGRAAAFGDEPGRTRARAAAASTTSRAALDRWIVGMPNGSRNFSAFSNARPGLGPAHRMTKPRCAAAAPQPLVFAAVDGLRRQLGDGDLGIAADRPEPALDAVAVGGRGVEGRDRRNTRAIDVEKGRAGVEPLDGEFLDRDIGAERGGLGRQPFRPGVVAIGRGAVIALRIPGGEPACGTIPRVGEDGHRLSPGQPFSARTIPARCSEPQIRTRAGPASPSTAPGRQSNASAVSDRRRFPRLLIPSARAVAAMRAAGRAFSSPGIVSA